MIKYKDIAFTAYAVTNMARAKKFYEGVLGLKPTRVFSKNFIEYDVGPGTLVVASAPKMWQPSRKGTCASLEVIDFEAALAHLKHKKIKLAIGPEEYPTCHMLAIRDPDGNMIALHQRKKMKKAGKS